MLFTTDSVQHQISLAKSIPSKHLCDLRNFQLWLLLYFSRLIWNEKWYLSAVIDTNIMALSTDRFEAIGVQLTGDELRFQRFSAPTHPTGYAWEEKQVKCKVKIIKKNVKTIPGKQFISIQFIHINNIINNFLFFLSCLKQVRYCIPFHHK